MASGFFESVPGEWSRRLQQMARSTYDSEPKQSDLLLSCDPLERLAAMQHRIARNYFRLVEADRDLRARTHSTPESVGTVLADFMDAERRRLGRELHTGVGQSLAGIRVHLAIIAAALPDPPEPVRKSLERITALADSALEQVRGVSRSLYIPAWQSHSLAEALRDLWSISGIAEKFEGFLDLRELRSEPPLEVRRALYLAAQEGISNAIQHADARRVRLSLREQDGAVVLEVEDDGSGFRAPVDATEPAASGGIGLRSLHDLARELSGEFDARSTPQGARLTMSIPVIE